MNLTAVLHNLDDLYPYVMSEADALEKINDLRKMIRCELQRQNREPLTVPADQVNKLKVELDILDGYRRDCLAQAERLTELLTTRPQELADSAIFGLSAAAQVFARQAQTYFDWRNYMAFKRLGGEHND